MSVLIVIPTYNESGTLEELVKKIARIGIANYRIMIVDDNSPDETAKLAENLSQIYPITVLQREKKLGLGTAYVYAFKKIFAEEPTDGIHPKFIIQMDADLSHDPEVIPQMLAKTQTCDLVLGSRYADGGRIENWEFLRRLVSYLGNWYARAVLGLPYRDLTGGFKCWKYETLGKIDLNSLSSVGYNFQIETTYHAHKRGFRICEIPITFTERKTGSSKFNIKIILESFWKVLALKFKD